MLFNIYSEIDVDLYCLKQMDCLSCPSISERSCYSIRIKIGSPLLTKTLAMSIVRASLSYGKACLLAFCTRKGCKYRKISTCRILPSICRAVNTLTL